MSTLYQGWYPRPATVTEIIEWQIKHFEADQAKLLAIMDEHDNNGWYAYHPEDRDIERDNLVFIGRMLDALHERYGDLMTRVEPRPAELRRNHPAIVMNVVEQVTP